jgi:DNA-binding CsgD family transcriptional regulator
VHRRLPPGLELADVAAMAVVYNVAGRALAGVGDSPARVRVRSATGAWAIVEADRLDPLEGTVAVTIRPAAAQDVLDLRLLAYDLTAREREVVTALLDGSDTRAVSQRLFLSPHTVNDHLKAIFAKVGVRTRKELTAMVAAPPREPAPEARPGA